MKRLVAGPCVSEFGWEIMNFQALVRKASRQYDETWVCAPEGHEALYADFHPLYMGHRICHQGVRDCWRISGADSSAVNATEECLKSLGGDRLLPGPYVPIEKQEFIRFGNPGASPPHLGHHSILMHARGRFGKRPECSWPQEKWDELVALLNRQNILCTAIGTEALLPAGAADMRNIALQELVDLMSRPIIDLIVGPSSGPLHLASLCGLKQLVWADRRIYSAVGGTSRERYEHKWNPFRTACVVLDRWGWQPSPVTVFDAIMSALGAALSRTFQ